MHAAISSSRHCKIFVDDNFTPQCKWKFWFFSWIGYPHGLWDEGMMLFDCSMLPLLIGACRRMEMEDGVFYQAPG